MHSIVAFYPDDRPDADGFTWVGQFYALDEYHEVRPAFLKHVEKGAKFAIIGTPSGEVWGLKMDGDQVVQTKLDQSHEFAIFGRFGHQSKQRELEQGALC